MKIDIISNDLITVFVNNFYFKDIDTEKKIELISIIKNLIVKIDSRYKLNLNGFYKIKVYPNKKIGVFLDIIKIDDNEFCNGADFRIVIYQNEKFYLELEDCDIINYIVAKRYYNYKFYIDVNDIENISELLDNGNIIYGDTVKEMLGNSKVLK